MELEIAKLLRAAWIAGILPILIASIPSSHFQSFHRLVSGFSNRGKTSLHNSNFTVPQRFFLHFYVVAVVWTTFLLLLTWLYAYKMVPLGHEPLHYTTIASHLTGGSHIFSRHKSHSTPFERRYIVWRTVLLLLLMELQVWRRLYETVYVFDYSSSARMHIFGYFTGLFFYTAAPLSLCSTCAPEVVNFAIHSLAEFIIKGRDKMPILEIDWLGYVNPLTKLGWFQWIGATVFIWGWAHQRRCHAILGSLRDHKEETDEYAIPHGDWFEFVSCPHYLAEMVIYGGLLIASGGSDLTIWLLFGFVVVNLVFAAAETQRWYIRKFENYPQTRGAVLPFVY
ncbi:hypothetical protein AQUCO_00600145v1 [Aquilegia coerulea]|uniref:3-oxo-5-alpha-steroid 4-dehydrogenase C-terminal domain-containing protein n=1 Tax=Aquilegia coerulea TaxID=218851 RepID=A0A2G5ENC8_AQUCA|nr:hypothetical protein AQUCO_00600145v1 [Aquilegia coerulea]